MNRVETSAAPNPVFASAGELAGNTITRPHNATPADNMAAAYQ
jgi:hypothetical protein